VDPAFAAFLVAAIGAMGGFTGWLIRAFISDLQKSRDRSLTMAEGSAVAIDRLADVVGKLRADLERSHRRETGR
jgi:hypothetical protein